MKLRRLGGAMFGDEFTVSGHGVKAFDDHITDAADEFVQLLRRD